MIFNYNLPCLKGGRLSLSSRWELIINYPAWGGGSSFTYQWYWIIIHPAQCKTVNLVNTLGWSRGMLSVNRRSHVMRHVLILRIFGAPRKLRFWRNREEVFNRLNSTNWVELHEGHARGHGVRSRAGVTGWGHVQGPRAGVTCRRHVSCPEWSAFYEWMEL